MKRGRSVASGSTGDIFTDDPSSLLGLRDLRLAGMRQALDSIDFAALGDPQQTMDLAPEAIAFDPTAATLAQMIQAMAAFGPASSASELLKRHTMVDTGVDWLTASAV